MPRQNQRDVNFFSLCVQVIVRLSYLVDPTKSLAHPEELSTGLQGPLSSRCRPLSLLRTPHSLTLETQLLHHQYLECRLTRTMREALGSTCERSVGTVFQLPSPDVIYSQDEGKERR
jgi:hypothetical protein